MEFWNEKSKWLIPACMAYVPLTALLRFQRVRRLKKQLGYTDRDSFAKMTNDDAWKIQQVIGELEFPLIFGTAVQFALFRTYGIPSISKLLVKTNQLSSPKEATKRYADTGALILEFVTNPPTHERTLEAIARVNYIHSVYRKSGQITNQDMLYTLALFAVEPVKWISKYEWRPLEDFEKCALGTFWKAIGDAMEIDYQLLQSSKTGWKDGLHWLDEIYAWSQEYEEQYMVPNQYNKTTADQTTAIILWKVPKFFKSAGLKVVSTLMDDRLRRAMLYDAPPPIYPMVINTIFSIRRFIIRYLSPPRPSFLRRHDLTYEPSPTGRYFFTKYDALPFYVKPTFWNRWGPESWTSRLLGLPLPGDDGDLYIPGGYKAEEIGPKFHAGKGLEEGKRTVERLRRERISGCPFGRIG